MASPEPVDFLILGAGWTSLFLIPALKKKNISYAATTTTGHDNTIPFRFDPNSDNLEPFTALPAARTILITFPLKGEGQSKTLTTLYHDSHSDIRPRWIQLGSTGIFTHKGWNDHTSFYDKENVRAIAEDELLACSTSTVLNLAGLYDDAVRVPKNWISRVAKNKEDVRGKTSLNMVHGKDVAQGIIGCHRHFDAVKGQRWILTDLFTYDWWGLMMDWGGTLEDGSDVRQNVIEVMLEGDVKALPRSHKDLGRALDSRAFWEAVKTVPRQGSVMSRQG